MNDSESMLTYRKEDGGSTLVASAYSWTPKSGRRLFRHESKKTTPQRQDELKLGLPFIFLSIFSVIDCVFFIFDV